MSLTFFFLVEETLATTAAYAPRVTHLYVVLPRVAAIPLVVEPPTFVPELPFFGLCCERGPDLRFHGHEALNDLLISLCLPGLLGILKP